MPGIAVPWLPLEPADEPLVAAAAAAIRRAYRERRHVVGAAVRGESGEIYTGVNVYWSTGGPCAEPVALGAAIGNGERGVRAVVAVEGPGGVPVPPCGNCRQMLLAYAPDAVVLVPYRDRLVKVRVPDLLPVPYLSRAERGPGGAAPP
jgi:cytidine deaminase